MKRYAIWVDHEVVGYADLEEKTARDLNLKVKGGCYFGFDASTINWNNGWTSVTEAIPEDQEEVLVCTLAKNGTRNIDKGYWAIDHFIHRGCAQVTHWMSLPKFPKGDRR